MADALEFGWHSGRLQPLNEIRISPLDRGFLFGDGVYEVIPVYDAKPLGLQQHLVRLERSLESINLPAPVDNRQLSEILTEVAKANRVRNQSMYLQISRRGDSGRDHKYPSSNEASLFVMSSPLSPASKERYLDGFGAITMTDERWQRCDIKSISMLANVMARQAAAEADALEAVLTRDDHLVEGAASAIACVIDGVVCAPPETNSLLPSVTRQISFDIARELDIDTRVEPLPMDVVRHADELLFMSSTKEIAPLVQLDGQSIGTGRPGPVWHRLFDGYQRRKAEL
ncbi:MAG: aminotransferase class IV [Pseudomonadota bacterium]